MDAEQGVTTSGQALKKRSGLRRFVGGGHPATWGRSTRIASAVPPGRPLQAPEPVSLR